MFIFAASHQTFAALASTSYSATKHGLFAKVQRHARAFGPSRLYSQPLYMLQRTWEYKQDQDLFYHKWANNFWTAWIWKKRQCAVACHWAQCWWFQNRCKMHVQWRKHCGLCHYKTWWRNLQIWRNWACIPHCKCNRMWWHHAGAMERIIQQPPSHPWASWTCCIVSIIHPSKAIYYRLAPNLKILSVW